MPSTALNDRSRTWRRAAPGRVQKTAEGGFDRGIFHLLGGATYTHARISESEVDPTRDGHIPYRQAAIVFQATPWIDTGRFAVGLNATGTTSSYAGDSNTLKMPGYVMTNGFASFDVTPAIRLGLNAQNPVNVVAVTEIGRPRDYIPADGIASARTRRTQRHGIGGAALLTAGLMV
jgi:hypothetical protein